MIWGNDQYGGANYGGYIIVISLGADTLAFQDNAIDVAPVGSATVNLTEDTIGFADQSIGVTASGTATVNLTEDTLAFADNAITVIIAVQPPGDDEFGLANKPIEVTSINTNYRGHQIVGVVDPDERELLRGFADQAGKVDVLTLADGSFESFDRSDTGISGTLDTPDKLNPPYEEATYRVQSYAESPVGQSNNQFEVQLSLVRETARERDMTVSDSQTSDGWYFDFGNDQISVPTVQINETTADSEHNLSIVTPRNDVARAVIQNPAYMDGVKEWPVSGGDDFAEDTTNNRQTVDVTPADGVETRNIVPSGSKIITNWSISKRGANEYEIEIQLKDPETP